MLLRLILFLDASPQMTRSPKHAAVALYHVATSPALGDSGGGLFSDTVSTFKDCGLEGGAAACGKVTGLPPQVGGRR